MAITLRQVSYTYHTAGLWHQGALRHIDLDIKAGQFVGIAGASGSGKSTLLQLFNGILKPSEGTVQVLDVTLQGEPEQGGKGRRKRQKRQKQPKLNELRRRVGLVFQFPEQQLFEETVEKDLCFGPLNFGMSLEEAKERAAAAMSSMGLDLSLLQRSPFELSGGQMRKVAIAMVLAMDPDILVLDEPAASLDPVSRQGLLQLLDNLCRQEGKTIVLVTHRMDEVLPLADHWIILDRGQVSFEGTVKELMKRSECLKAAGLTIPASMECWLSVAALHGLEDEQPCLSPAAMAERIQRLLDQAEISTAAGKEDDQLCATSC